MYLHKLIIVFSKKTINLFGNRVIKLVLVVRRIAFMLSRAFCMYLKLMISFRQINRL